jgi:hypothetical protein
MRPYDLAPRFLVDALIAATKYDKDWLTWEYASAEESLEILGKPLPHDRRGYKLGFKPGVRLGPVWQILGKPAASDLIGFKALGAWAAGGPKTFVPTAEQCEALENVDVNLTLDDYAQPFPTLFVKLPKERYYPFVGALAHLDETGGPARMLSLSLFTHDNKDDVVTTVSSGPNPIEDSLRRFDRDCGNVQHVAPRVQRVAANCCLVLAGDPSLKVNWMYPHERASDERLALEETERGLKARTRLNTSPMLVSFSQQVTLRRTEGPAAVDAVPAGYELHTHWRRGHWAMQPHGPKHSLRKRIFRPPVLVRADLFTGDRKDAGATYRG